MSQKGFTTIFFAIKRDAPSLIEIALRFGKFFLDVVLFNLGFAVALGFIVGYRSLLNLSKQWISNLKHSPFDLYLLVTAIGPVALVLAATFFGVRPRIQWFVPMSLSFVAIGAALKAIDGG